MICERPLTRYCERPLSGISNFVTEMEPSHDDAVAVADFQNKSQLTRCILTLQVPDGTDPVPPAVDLAFVDFACYQLEAAPSTGKLHWHLYLRFSQKKRFNQVQAMYPGAWIGRCKGSEAQCIKYCSKEETFVPGDGHRAQLGQPKLHAGKQGHRSDLDDVADMVKNNASLVEIAEAHPTAVIRYSAGIEKLKTILAPPVPLMRRLEVVVLWGPGGTGKTYRVRHLFQDDIYCPTAGDTHPWDKYEDQDCLFLDEFNPAHWDPQLLNMMLDPYRVQLPCRYQNKMARWTKVYICTNLDPMTFYDQSVVAVQQAVRRRLFTGCFHVTARQPENFRAFENVPIFTEYGAVVKAAVDPNFILAPPTPVLSPLPSPRLKRTRCMSPVLDGDGSSDATQLQTQRALTPLPDFPHQGSAEDPIVFTDDEDL